MNFGFIKRGIDDADERGAVLACAPRLDLHEAAVPVFLRYLDRLRGLVDAAAAHAQAHGLADRTLLDARLAPDMLPFESQVRTAANFALRASFPLAGLEIPPPVECPTSFDGLRALIDHVVEQLGTLSPAQFQGAEARVIESRAGEALVRLPGSTFLLQYALPNFFFHLTSAYAILRQRGVPLGKAQFDGFHHY